MIVARTLHRLRRALGGARLPVWFHPDYRLPLGSLEGTLGLEPRRADHVLWYLLEVGAIDKSDVHTPRRARYADLSRVHTAEWLEALGRPEGLASAFGVHPSEVNVDEAMNMVRLATGGTIEASREALASGGATLNLQGGFHHAFPGKGGGLCAVNDIAVALAVLRAEGFAGRAVVIDLDAHPPDGTAACLASDGRTWIGSISGSDWGVMVGVSERCIPGADDAAYGRALAALLAEMPRPDLAFVIAGGDVLAGDRLGKLALSLAGARRRDLAVAEALSGLPSVWLPGGGYAAHAWKVLAGTGLALALRSEEAMPEALDPLEARFEALSRAIRPVDITGDLTLSDDDLGMGPSVSRAPHRYLGLYSAEGVEFALHHYGIIEQVARLGYVDLRVLLDRAELGERFRLLGKSRDPEDVQEHLLAESVLEVQRAELPLTPGLAGSGPGGGGVPLLYVHWLTLRNPRAQFGDGRPRLPGQDVPGLGLAPEASELIGRIADRLGLAGVALRPAWYHVAYAVRSRFRFVEPARQGRFEALIRDLRGTSLREATARLAERRVALNGLPYDWEADLMVAWRAHP